MAELQDEYNRLNGAFNLDDAARYDAQQADVFRKVVHRIRDAVPGGHEVDLDGLVDLVRNLVPNAELSGPRPLAAEGSRSNDGLGNGGK